MQQLQVKNAHIIHDIHVGPELHKQTHAVSVTIPGGKKQRRAPVLRLANKI